MDSFHDRKDAFEKKFAHDKELRMKGPPGVTSS